MEKIIKDIITPDFSDPTKYQNLHEKLSFDERNLIYTLNEKTQKQIASELNMTQGAISARISKIQKKLKFLYQLTQIDDSKLEEDLKQFITNLGIDIIKYMKMTTSQSRTADLINEKYNLKDDPGKMTQVKIRYRFERCYNTLQNLAKTNPELQKYYDLLTFIRSNLYMFQGWRKNGLQENINQK